MPLGLALLLLTPPAAGRLGDPDYRVREFEHRRLAAMGWLAYPWLAAGARDSSPEVRLRCGVLLGGLGAADAAELLAACGCLSWACPGPDPDRLYLDHGLRRRVAAAARAAGARGSAADALLPESYGHWAFFSSGAGERADVAAALRACRADVWARHAGPWFTR